MAYYKFASAIRQGRPIQLYNQGRMARDFTYIDDVVAAMVRLVAQPPHGVDRDSGPPRPDRGAAPFRIYNIGNHVPVELGTFVDVLERCLGQTAIRDYAPMQLGDVVRTFADVTALGAATAFAPATPLEDGLRAFVAWFDRYHGFA
jgi:UDP-glucuronate 4-epimerase